MQKEILPGSGAFREITGTSFRATNLKRNTQYTIEVIPFNNAGDGNGDTNSQTTMPGQPAGDLAGLRTSNIGRTSITWTWNPSARATGYKYRYAKGNSAGVGAFTNITGTSFRATGLEPGTEYTIEVIPFNTFGDGDGGTHSATTTAPTPPDDLSGLKGKATTRNSITWEWDPSARATGYKYRYVEGSSAPTTGAYTNITATEIEITGLDSGTEYTIEVIPFNVDGDGDGQTDSETTDSPPSSAPTNAPSNLKAASQTATSIVWSWDEDSFADSYEYRYVEGTSDPTEGAWTETTNTSIEITSLQDNTSYTFEVRSKNEVGSGPSSTDTDKTLELPSVDIPAPSRIRWLNTRLVIFRSSNDREAGNRYLHLELSLNSDYSSAQVYYSTASIPAGGTANVNRSEFTFAGKPLVYARARFTTSPNGQGSVGDWLTSIGRW